jgi:HSP20 family molecular chaperone IbpA
MIGEVDMPLTTTSDESSSQQGRQSRGSAGRLIRSFYSISSTDVWTPSVNLYETSAAYQVCVDLAGVEKEKLSLTVRNNRLQIAGSRPTPRQPTPAEAGAQAAPQAHPASEPPKPRHAERARVHLMEIDHGAFCREVELPADVDDDRIAAQYINGMLWIELPKRFH